jgi:hypothetical protein
MDEETWRLLRTLRGQLEENRELLHRIEDALGDLPLDKAEEELLSRERQELQRTRRAVRLLNRAMLLTWATLGSLAELVEKGTRHG